MPLRCNWTTQRSGSNTPLGPSNGWIWHNRGKKKSPPTKKRRQPPSLLILRLPFCGASLLTQLVRKLPVIQDTTCSVGELGLTPGLRRSPEKEMVTQSSMLAWRIPWTEEPGWLQSLGSWVGHDWVTKPPPPVGQDSHISVQFSSVTQLCPTLCHPMNCSTPGLPVHHQLPEFTQADTKPHYSPEEL